MSTVIDSLLLELGIDNKKFKAGMKESERVQEDFKGKATQHSQETEKEEKKAETERKRRHVEQVKQHRETLENYKKMREDLLKFFLIFTAGKEIGDFISETVRSSMEIGQLSEATGIAVGKISGLQVAFKEVGGTADEANSAIAKASQANADFFEGRENAMNRELNQQAYGTKVDLRGAHDKNDPLAFMKAQADVIHALKEQEEKGMLVKGAAHSRAGLMGVSGHLFDLMLGGGADFEKKIKHGASLTGMDAKKAETAARFNKEWTDLLEKFEAVGVEVLMPVLEELTKWLGSKENMEAFTKAFKGIVDGLKKVNWEALGKGLEVLAEGLITVVGWMSTIVGTITGKDAKSDFNTAVDSVLPEFVSKLFDQMDILTGTQSGTVNNKTHSVQYHIGTQIITVPESVNKDKRLLGAYLISAMQANTP